MAVQIINEMPDAEVHRGDPVGELLRELNAPRARRTRFNGRVAILAITIGLHSVVAIALVRMQFSQRGQEQPVPIEASLLEAPVDESPPPTYTPPPMNIVYSLPTPQEITIETESVSEMTGTAITSPGPVTTVAPPMVESVEYVRAAPPVYPKESQRKREHGTVVLRVLVDEHGRPAQIQIERSSGFDRLDTAARQAVEKFLFRPYEVNGVAQPAQVLIPIGFDRRAS
ncbi:MAG TPA: energy transducer TonB [Steroidobacteraceae bacterium]|nr:energy transducer TonB [Steroidobacteraceae bacterium]